MKVYEIGTGYTPIPAQMGAATEIVVEQLTKAFLTQGVPVEIVDIASDCRAEHNLPICQVSVPRCFSGTDVHLGIMHKMKRVVYSIALAYKLKKILQKTEEKVILHFHNQYNLFFFLKLIPRKLREKAKIAYTNHSYIWHGEWNIIKDTVHKRYFQEIYCMQHADVVFVLNEQTRRTIIQEISVDANRTFLIGNGVNTEIYHKVSEEKKIQLKKAMGLSGKHIFIQVGSVCERKNQLGALQKLLPLLQENESVAYCYAGGIIDPEYQKTIQQVAVDNRVSDRVFYCGELTPGRQLNEFYNLADAMIFPSKAEGFSLVILEAMSAGIPVLITPNLRFAMAEQCICYYEDEFVDIVKKNILDVDRLSEWSSKARQVIVDSYSWDSIAQDYLNIWKFTET